MAAGCDRPLTLRCVVCGRAKRGHEPGWRRFRDLRPGTRELGGPVAYCPVCGEREFGPLRRRRRPA